MRSLPLNRQLWGKGARPRLCRTAAALLLAGAMSASIAADYYIVVPSIGRTSSPTEPSAPPAPAITLTLNGYPLPAALVGRTYAGFDFNTVLQVSGDAAFDNQAVSWSLVGGALPEGLTLGADGVLSGTPTAAGNASFQVKASYKTADGTQAFEILTGEVQVALAGATLPAAVQGAAYLHDFKPQLSVSGAPAFTHNQVLWTLEGALPQGLVFNADGTITGVPTAEGSYPFTVRAQYLNQQGEQAYQVLVGEIVVSLASASLPTGKHQQAYSYNFKPLLTITGDAAYADAGETWRVVTALPSGLSLNAGTGVLSGTPADAASGVTITVEASYKGKIAQGSYILSITPTALVSVGSPSAYRYEDGSVAPSCKAYLEGQPGYAKATQSGFYLVDMGAGTETVYCDMVSEGGGWTLVARSAGTSPAYADCNFQASVNTPFGWSVSRGSPRDVSTPYSMGVFAKQLNFSEVLIGSASGSSNSWGAYKYRQPVPQNFKTAYSTASVAVSPSGFNMSKYMGFTADTTQYYFRDVSEQSTERTQYGLHADGWLTCYGDGETSMNQPGPASKGGYLNYRHGLLMVR